MTRKWMGLLGGMLALFAGTGCCRMCDRWCGEKHNPPACCPPCAAPCAAAPACGVPACAPPPPSCCSAPPPSYSSPPPPQTWQRNYQANGSCP